MTNTLTARHFKSGAEPESGHIPSTEPEDTRRQLARILLQRAATDNAEPLRISMSELAAIMGVSKNMVNDCLRSLQAEGAIRIERHRMIINKETLEQIAMDTTKTRA